LCHMSGLFGRSRQAALIVANYERLLERQSIIQLS
jgi:hypothetical protein